MLEKKKWVCHPEKLRAILLMEADFNFPNKLFLGKWMVDWAEEHNEVPDKCYGSCKGHHMIDVAVNRCLTLDILQQKQIPGSILSVDASNCYDCLAHNMTSLANQHLAVAAKIMVCLLTTIQMMVFFLRTAYSNSQTSYRGCQ